MIQLKEKLDAASLYVKKMIGEEKVDIGMILGSGLGSNG